MNRNSLFVFAIAIFCLAGATVLFAAGYDDCQMAIRDQINANNPQVEKIRFDASSETREDVSYSETIYRGYGQFVRHTGKEENFSWECSYNAQRGTINTVHYSVLVAPPPVPGTPVPELKDLMGVRASQGEQKIADRGYKYLRTENTNSASFMFWREIKTGFCVLTRIEDGRYTAISFGRPSDCVKK